jgi:hypothetical protein
MKTKLQVCANLMASLCTFKKNAAFILSLVFGNFIQAQTTPAWIDFVSAADYQNYDVQEVSVGLDSVGNIYIAGSMHDTVANQDNMLLVKYNSSGVQQWMRTFDNSTDDKHVVAILVDKAGNSYLCGYGYITGTSTSIDYIVMKYDNAGNQQWVKNWDGGYSAWDFITCATFDPAGNIIVAGYCNNNGGPTGEDIGIVKYSTSGTQIWSYVYNNTAINGDERAMSVASDPAGNVFVTGSSMGTQARDMITLKVNNAGINQWIKTVAHVNPGTDEHGRGVTTDAAGNSYATGAAGDWITIKYDPNGTVVWTNHIVTAALSDQTKKIMLDKHGNVIVAGDAFFGAGNQSDLAVYKLNSATGASLSSVDFYNNGSDIFSDAVLDTSGNVYLSGYYVGPLGIDMLALTVSSSGSVLWSTTYSNPYNPTGTDEAYHLAVDKNRNLILVGVSERRGSGGDGIDIVTLRYSALVTGIQENSLSQINMNIYPNPAKDHLNIRINDQSLIGSTILISNVMGQTIKEETLTSLEQQIKLEQMPKGIYLVEITSEKSFATGKLIIE